MKESQEILLRSLEDYGVSIPDDVSSIQGLTPATLVSICAQCLNLVDKTASLPTSLPDSMVDQFKICTDIALALKRLGYLGDMTYYKLLYPSEDDLYKIIRFLVERLSKTSDGVKTTNLKDADSGKIIKEDNSTNNTEDWTKKADIEELNHNFHEQNLKDLSLSEGEPDSLNVEVEDISFSWSRRNFSTDEPVDTASENLFSHEEGQSERTAFRHEETISQEVEEHILKATCLEKQSSEAEVRNEIEKIRNQETMLKEKVNRKNSELRHLKEELELLKEAAEMAFDNQHPTDFHIENLSEKVDAGKHKIKELELQWDTFREPLEEKKRRLEEVLYADISESQEKLQKLREVELDKQSIISEIKRREEECYKLSADLEKQPIAPSRASYIERIKEITKNSRKQDADIERILKETRELQLESNSIQERLHRTYAVLDEIIFREAKKDPVVQQAYRLLTTIHDSFEQISEKILARDRIRREVAEHEKKLAAMTSRSLNTSKLQSDLDAIVRENSHLEQQLQDKSNQ